MWKLERYQKRPIATCNAAMVTILKWRWRGGCSNGIALFLYWLDTHRHTYAHTAQNLFSPHKRSAQVFIAQFNLSIISWRHKALLQIKSEGRLITAVEACACTSWAHVYCTCKSAQRKRIHSVPDPISCEMHSWVLFLPLSPPLVFCLFSSMLSLSPVSMWNPLLCGNCGRDCVIES